MAASIVRAYEEGRRVVHLIGQFHSDFEGGTVREIRRRAAQAKVLNISMQREWPGDLLDEDRGRADFVVYTGERPPEPEEDENEPTIEEGTLPGEEPPSSSPEDAPGAEQGAAPSGSAEPPGAAET